MYDKVDVGKLVYRLLSTLNAGLQDANDALKGAGLAERDMPVAVEQYLQLVRFVVDQGIRLREAVTCGRIPAEVRYG